MAADLHGKLDQVINNQHDLLTRMEKMEASHEEMEKSITSPTKPLKTFNLRTNCWPRGLPRWRSKWRRLSARFTNFRKLVFNKKGTREVSIFESAEFQKHQTKIPLFHTRK